MMHARPPMFSAANRPGAGPQPWSGALANKLHLLVTYLHRCGPTSRQELAALLWPHAAAPQNCLRVALSHLRRLGVPVYTSEDLVGVTTHDIGLPDLGHLDLSSVSDEFEEWVLKQREQAAAQVQEAMLHAADTAPDRHALLWQAWHVPDAPLPTAATLARFLNLCPANTPLHRTLTAELTDLTGDWATDLTTPFEQALLASWLEGGVTWLPGDAPEIMRVVTRLQDVLTSDGQTVLHLPLDSALDASLLKVMDLQEPRALTVILTPGSPVNDAALTSTLAAWPDMRFIIVGRAAPASATGQTLTAPAAAARAPRPAPAPLPSGTLIRRPDARSHFRDVIPNAAVSGATTAYRSRQQRGAARSRGDPHERLTHHPHLPVPRPFGHGRPHPHWPSGPTLGV
ncbi:hypothetical protein [Deinococcus soli (ex Cha et al. 2016)]|uniref:hypothetical protein n=1 Tax=Deinococcus soli (ex Cha et al. 2016) TaxID=1309411 RepID=UPI00166D1EC5|nr:hypothetical protein [Deinococcus soli (ex Cha et al. 2016)]GGB81835.1 hypothetical protein GCM10008019_42560 [Deinococcus soli (ex Cha et al. 2016)]